MSLRDCLFLVADKNMEGMLRGFFDREQFHLALKCRPFTFHPQHDLVVAHGQNDSGLFTRANELLQPFAATHRHAVVIVDAQWDGAPPADEIRVRLAAHLAAAGWQEDAGCAVVIDPELENWFWQESPHVCRALGEADTPFAEVRRRLTEKGFWPEFQPKPIRPKEALELILRANRKPRSSAIYRDLAGRVSVAKCEDSSFQHLRAALRRWFPEG